MCCLNSFSTLCFPYSKRRWTFNLLQWHAVMGRREKSSNDDGHRVENNIFKLFSARADRCRVTEKESQVDSIFPIWKISLSHAQVLSHTTKQQIYLFSACKLRDYWENSLTAFELTISLAISIAITRRLRLEVHLRVVHVCHRGHRVVIGLTELARFGPHWKRRREKVLRNK